MSGQQDGLSSSVMSEVRLNLHTGDLWEKRNPLYVLSLVRDCYSRAALIKREKRSGDIKCAASTSNNYSAKPFS